MIADPVAQPKAPSAVDDSRTVAVVLNYRTPNDTVRAVHSLKGSRRPVADIIVVDNGSDDGSAAYLAASMPGVRLLETGANGGFSSGCNIGIREALRLGAERVLLLNGDVVVTDSAIGGLEQALDGDPRLGVVGPIIVSQTDPARVESLGLRYSHRTGRMRHIGSGAFLRAVRPFECREVDAVSGAAMLITRELLDRIGLLAEEYFFGFEDLDFCLRGRIAGFRSACVGSAIVQHEGSRSIGRASSHRIYFATRNHLLLAGRCSPSRSVAARYFRTAAVLGFNLAHVLLTSNVSFADGLRGFVEGARDHLAGRYGPRPRRRAGRTLAPPRRAYRRS